MSSLRGLMELPGLPLTGAVSGRIRGQGVAINARPKEGGSMLSEKLAPVMLFCSVAALAPAVAQGPSPQEGKLRVIAIGAHPDDCDIKFAGTAAKFAKAGHAVKFLSVTNGD